MISSFLWETRSMGLLVPPSFRVAVFLTDTLTITNKIAKIVKIPLHIKKFSEELSGVQSTYQLPIRMMTSPFPYKIYRGIQAVCFVALSILGILSIAVHLGRPVLHWIAPRFVQKPMNIDEKHQFIQRSLSCLSPTREPSKQEISVLSGELIRHIREVEQTVQTGEMMDISRRLIELKGRLEAVLDRIAKEDDPSDREEVIGSMPYMALSVIGLRESDFKTIARRIGWSENEHIYLTLKFAEKGIFSIKDLDDVKKKRTTEEQIEALILKLQDPVVGSRQSTKWKLTQQMAMKIHRVTASIFAVSFHLFSLLTIYQTPFLMKLFEAADGCYYGYYSTNLAISRSVFVNGRLKDKLDWVFRTSSPIFGLSYAITKAIRGPGICALPLILYEIYLA